MSTCIYTGRGSGEIDMWRYVGRYETDANVLVSTTPVGNWDRGLDLEV